MTVAAVDLSIRRRGAAVVRALLCAGAVATGLSVATVWSHAYRQMEATLAASVAGLAVDSHAWGESWVVRTSTGDALVLMVSSACTTSLMVAPLFLAAAWALLLPRLRVGATVAGLCAGLAVLLGLGTLRLCLIGLAWHRWGNDALWVTHDVLGTLISVLAASTALLVMFVVMSRAGSDRSRGFDDGSTGPTVASGTS